MSPFSLGHSLPSDRGVCPFVWDANGEKVPALMCRKYSMQAVKFLPAVAVSLSPQSDGAFMLPCIVMDRHEHGGG